LRQWEQTKLADRVDQTSVPYSPEREWFTLAITVTPQTPPAVAPPPGVKIGNGESETLPKKTFFYTFIVFPAGKYEVGLTAEQPDDNTQPPRRIVTLTKPFAILDREITMDEMIAFNWTFIKWLPSQKSERQDAAADIMWREAIDFCYWLDHEAGLPRPVSANLISPQYRLQKGGFRLPTEAEWEIASRAGSCTAFGFGGDTQALLQFEWVKESFCGGVKPPKKLRPNVAGMFDMHGNVAEWTIDSARDYAEVPPIDPKVIDDNYMKIYRGGNSQMYGLEGRSAARHFLNTASRINLLGFRLALSVSDGPQPSESATQSSPPMK
ncbi:MAG: formylglycine-generating enzyme family protein, partial [Planctomycetota bacterium]